MGGYRANVALHGRSNWTIIASVMPGRNGKQCRERWINRLDPLLNQDEWTPQDDELLLNQHKKFGNCWAKIVKFLPGRSANAVKNRWTSSVKQRVQTDESDETMVGPEDVKRIKKFPPLLPVQTTAPPPPAALLMGAYFRPIICPRAPGEEADAAPTSGTASPMFYISPDCISPGFWTPPQFGGAIPAPAPDHPGENSGARS